MIAIKPIGCCLGSAQSTQGSSQNIVKSRARTIMKSSTQQTSSMNNDPVKRPKDKEWWQSAVGF